jgi:hypothetical protein
MSLQQNVVEPLDASFTELTQTTDDTTNLLVVKFVTNVTKPGHPLDGI